LASWLLVSAIVSLSLRAAVGFDMYVTVSAVAACLAFVLLAFSATDLVLIGRGFAPLNIDDPAQVLRSKWIIPLTMIAAIALAAKLWG
jgi:hypothetical protein